MTRRNNSDSFFGDHLLTFHVQNIIFQQPHGVKLVLFELDCTVGIICQKLINFVKFSEKFFFQKCKDVQAIYEISKCFQKSKTKESQKKF